MSLQPLLHRCILLALLTCIARGAPHDFTAGHGTSPGGPGNPNDGQPPCHNGSSSDPDAAGDSDPVDLFRGELILDRRDLFVPGRGLGVDATFHYRSKSVANGQFGYGWTFSYSRRIRKLDDGNAVLLQGTNMLQEYVALGGGAYESPCGIYSTLHENGNGTFTLTYRHGAVETYDVNGCLASLQDPSGNAITLEYDPAGLLPVIAPSKYLVHATKAVVAREYRLTRLTDTIGNEYDFLYNADGLLAEIQYLGRTIEYAYTPEGDLASVTLPGTAQFPAGRRTSYAYVDHNLTEVRNAEDEVTLVTAYDAGTDRVTSQTFDGGTATYAIATVGGTTKATVVDRKGFTTEYTFNADGQVVESKRLTDGVPAGEPAAYVTTYEYAATGELVRVVYPRGNAVELTRGALGLITEVRQKKIGATAWTPSPDDIVETYTYESVYHQIKTATDPLGRTTTFTYDYELAETARSLLRKVTLPPPPSGPAPEIEYTYDANGLLVQVEDPNGNLTQIDRDVATGYVDRVTRGYGTAAATQVELDHDAFGNVTKMRNGLGHETTIAYDAHDMVTKITSPAPLSFETHYRYDANDRVAQVDREIAGGQLPVIGSSDPQDGWQTTRYTYDAFGRTIAVIDDHGQSTGFSYDSNGNLRSVLDAAGKLTTFAYDERDLPLNAVDSQLSAGTTEFRYDPNGNLSSVRTPEGHLTTYLYDDFDRLTRTSYADFTYEEYGYDKGSNVTSLLTPNGQTIIYGLDELNRVTSITRPGGMDVYTYDLGGRMTLASNAEAAVSFLYDAADRSTHEITTFAGSLQNHVVEHRFDAADRLDRIIYPDLSEVVLGYDQLERMTTISAATLLATYRYDPLGNTTSIERASGVDTIRTFDSLKRLIQIHHEGPAGTLDSRTFAYDALNRRTDEVGPEGAHEFEYDGLSQLVAITRPAGYPFIGTAFAWDGNGSRTMAGGVSYVSNALDQYSSIGAVVYAYDLSGSLLSDGTFTYSYDASSRLTGASGLLLTASYGYDALGRRVRKTVNGTATLYVHDGLHVLQELNAAEIVQATYVYGLGPDDPLTMQRDAVTSWYLADPIGTVTTLTDGSGAIAESYRYDAFGESAIFNSSGSPLSSSALGNEVLFAGRVLDTETGLYHFRARAYSPALGRFFQRDPLGQIPDSNLYRYVGNHPLDAIDPYGLWEEKTHWTEWIPFDDYIFSPGAANFSAGVGDTLTWGVTDKVRDRVGGNEVVDKCSGAYNAGEWTGVALSTATGGLQGLGGAGAKGVGKQFSHFVPDRLLTRLGPWAQRLGQSRLNGNYVSKWRHYKHDAGANDAVGELAKMLRNEIPGLSKRESKAMARQALGPKWGVVRSMLDRVPRLPFWTAAGASYGYASKNRRKD